MRQGSNSSEASKGWEHIFSLGGVPRGERSHRSSSTRRSSNNHIYSYTGDHYISLCILETKKTREAHAVDKHSAEIVDEWWLGVDT